VPKTKHGIVAAIVAVLTGTLIVPVVAAPTLLLSQAGCAGDDCDGDTQTWGSCTQGELAGGAPNVWESGPVTGKPYLDFHGERTWVLDPTPWMGSRQPIGFDAYLSLDPNPNQDAQAGFALPAGNLAELKLLSDGKVQVLNDTCAQYYLRVVLTYPPGTPNGGGCKMADGGE
jgi:hypothetical protein